jgi:hypothetical protein
MIPCFYKYFFDFECPGCGFQRSILAFLDGKLFLSIEFFPGLLPLIVFAFLEVLSSLKVYNGNKWKKITFLKNVNGILALTIQIIVYCLRWMEVLPWTENIHL